MNRHLQQREWDKAAGLVAAVYGADLSQRADASVLSLLQDVLDEVRLAAEGGDWKEAELKQLEVYTLFDPDIEQHLMPRAGPRVEDGGGFLGRQRGKSPPGTHPGRSRP